VTSPENLSINDKCAFWVYLSSYYFSRTRREPSANCRKLSVVARACSGSLLSVSRGYVNGGHRGCHSYHGGYSQMAHIEFPINWKSISTKKR
jgi:hypothetical protein